MKQKDEAIFINVELERKELNIVTDVFLQMIEQRNEIDFGMMDLWPFEDFEVLVRKFESLPKNGDHVTIIPMSLKEWSVYTSYIKHSHDLVLDYEEGELMGDLGLKYNRINTNYGEHK